MTWAPLHLHSVYSNFDGAIGISKLVEWAEHHEVPAVAVTDHGMMASVPSFHAATARSAVKPIFGCELYMDPVMRTETARPAYHLVALAMNERGYRNLMKLLSFAHRDNFYSKPRVTIEKIREFSEGITFSSACISGELPQLLLAGRTDDAKKWLADMKSACSDGFRIELMDTGDRDERQLAMNESLYELALSTGTGMIMTNDAHYFEEDRSWHPHILAVNRGSTLDEMKAAAAARKGASEYDDGDLSMFDLSLRSPKTMEERWRSKYPEALDGTTAVARDVERYGISPKGYYMPEMERDGGKPLRILARDGLEERLRAISGRRAATREAYLDRLEYELGMVEKTGFGDYFLMVHDVVDWARGAGIFVGPGRGSAAGSILAWSLGITAVDPLRHNLLFERFINPERVSMPDIDVDFEDSRRGEVLAYLSRRYGRDSVSGIIGYSEAKWKRSLRDAAKTLGIGAGEHETGGMFASAVGGFIDAEGLDGERGRGDDVPGMLVEAAAKANPTLESKKEEMLRIASLAQKFLSLVRHYTRHASGVVIAPPDVTDHCPLYNLKGAGEMVVQYDMDGVEAVKLIKMDILGLSNLSIMRDTWETARKFDPSTPSPDEIYAFLDSAGEDPASEISGKFLEKMSRRSIENALDILGAGDTTGIFQLMSPGMRKLLAKLKPGNMDELSALIALYRPGPLASGMTKSYIESKNGGTSSPFPDEVAHRTKGITADSSGMVIYQEQVMAIARLLGGYSLGEADMLRRAMGKKKAEVMMAEKARFVERCVANGLGETDASDAFDTLAHFAGYGFNKSHSTAYAYLAFATAWYKANREPAFWCAFLEAKARHEKKEDMAGLLREAGRSWKLNPPSLIMPGDALSDVERCRVVRTGRRFGEAMPEPEKVRSVNEALWSMPEYWALFLGGAMMNGLSEAKMNDFERWSPPGNFADILASLVLDDAGRTVNPKQVARLVLAGVFDNALANSSHTRRVLEGLPSGGDAMFEEDTTIPSIQDDFPLPVFRALLVRMEEESAKNPAFAELVGESLSGLVADGTNVEERLRKTDRNRFPAWVSLLVSRLRAKTSLKKNPWGPSRVASAIARAMRVFAHLAKTSVDAERESFVSFTRRMELLRALYANEALDFGEGLSVPSWVLASEIFGWSASGYVDELGAFEKCAKAGEKSSFSKTPWGKSICGFGLWFVGYANRTTSNAGRTSLVLSGRWGEAVGSVFADIPRDVEVKRFVPGDVCAVRLAYDTKGGLGWGGWKLREMIVPKLGVAVGETETNPVWLCGASGNPVVRLRDDMDAETADAMLGYLSGEWLGSVPDAKGLLVARAPREIRDAERVAFSTLRFPFERMFDESSATEKEPAETGGPFL